MKAMAFINVIIRDEELDNTPIGNSPSIIAEIPYLNEYRLFNSIVAPLKESAQSLTFLGRY